MTKTAQELLDDFRSDVDHAVLTLLALADLSGAGLDADMITAAIAGAVPDSLARVSEHGLAETRR